MDRPPEVVIADEGCDKRELVDGIESRGRRRSFRRVATRYETTAANVLGMALFVAITIWLRR